MWQAEVPGRGTLRLEHLVLDLNGTIAQDGELVPGVAAVGNGANDAAMLREAALGIAVLGPEGLAAEALLAADVLVRDVRDALDLLLQPERLVATWRI